MRSDKKTRVRTLAGTLALLIFILLPSIAAAERMEVQVGKEVIADLGGVSAEHPYPCGPAWKCCRRVGMRLTRLLPQLSPMRLPTTA